MKSALILAAACAVAAQNLSGEPACATSCLVSAISAAGCAPSDMDCQCGPTQSAIGGFAATCLISACTNPADLVTAASVGSALCASYLATASMTITTAPNATVTSTKATVHTGNGTATHKTILSTTTVPSNSSISTQKPTSQSTSSPNAAATPVALGMGALAGLLGVMAAL